MKNRNKKKVNFQNISKRKFGKWFWKLIVPFIVIVIGGIILLKIEELWFFKKEIVIHQSEKPKSSVGGLVGHAGSGTKITNSSVDNTTMIIDGDTSNLAVGGLVGSSDSGVVIDSSN